MMHGAVKLSKTEAHYIFEQTKALDKFLADKKRISGINSALKKISEDKDLQKRLESEGAELRIGETNLWLTGKGLYYDSGLTYVRTLVPVREHEGVFSFPMIGGPQTKNDVHTKLVCALRGNKEDITGKYLLDSYKKAKQQFDDITY